MVHGGGASWSDQKTFRGRVDPALAKVVGFDDIRALAKRRLPRVVFDFVDGAAGAEHTMRANRLAFEQVSLRPRQANAPAATDLFVNVLGEALRMPILLAPCGSARVIHPDGEPAIARAAARAGTAYVVPHLGGTRCEDLRRDSTGSLWYQIYQYGGREVSEPAIRRAWSAGYRILVVTVDNARTVRERDVRNGLGPLLGGNLRRALPYMGQMLARPKWLARFLRDSGTTATPNAVLPDGRTMSPLELAAAAARADGAFRWPDFKWLREIWSGPILAKGILTADDARRAVDCGIEGLIVSNHGGRTLDGLEATLRALPEVVAAVPSQFTVLLDSGVRRGPDVIKALCLGARAVLIGRPYMLALSCGEPGIARMLSLLETDLRHSLATLGCGSLAELSRELVRTPADWALEFRACRTGRAGSRPEISPVHHDLSTSCVPQEGE
jgi:isopentenyl diphosphate isomerase/L-lactate dehydrogenase-like FMN-dependent dehydrogenase